MQSIFVTVLLVFAAASPAWAQDVAAVEVRIESLRAQLREVTDKEAQLQTRAGQLDDDLKSENIERSIAPIGTTDAAALREERRAQLKRQKAAVDEQLASLAASRARLESAIATAEAEAVRLKAAALAPKEAAPRNTPTVAPATPTSAPAVRRKAPARKRTPHKRSRPRRRV